MFNPSIWTLMMEKEYNNLIIKNLTNFILSNKLFAYQNTSNIRKLVFEKNLKRGFSYKDIEVDIKTFNIFEPISNFNYGKSSLYLIEFKDELNDYFFNICLNLFNNTEYEKLFFSTITKIIPINYCIKNQSWSIVEKILTCKQFKSNGLPTVEQTKSFFYHLNDYINEKTFNNSLKTFCENNKSLLKRIETQQYLKDFITKLNDACLFEKFINLNENIPLSEIKQDFYSYYFNKSVLFSKLSKYVINKNEPIEKLDKIIQFLNKNAPKQSKIKNIFIHQKEIEFKELIILVSFHEKYDTFEEYLFLILEDLIKNKQNIETIIENTTKFFFLNKELSNKNIKEKINKI